MDNEKKPRGAARRAKLTKDVEYLLNGRGAGAKENERNQKANGRALKKGLQGASKKSGRGRTSPAGTRAKLTKDLERLLTAKGAGAKQNQHDQDAVEQAFKKGVFHGQQTGDLIFGSSGKIYSKKAIREFAGKSPQVMVKLTTYRKTKPDLKNHVDYISRNGKIPLIDQDGNQISGQNERYDVVSEWNDVELTKAKNRAKYLGKESDDFNYPRVAASLVFSMPPGTDREKFEAAMHDFCDEQFTQKGYEFLAAFHHDTEHPHMHLLLRLRNMELGRKLDPKKETFREWRTAMKEKMQAHGLMATATPNRLNGKLKSQNRKSVQMDYREMATAMAKQGLSQQDIYQALKKYGKSKLQGVMNENGIFTRRQENLKRSVTEALKNEKTMEAIDKFERKRKDERKELLAAIGDLAKDIVATHPEEAGMLIKHAQEMEDPTPDVKKIIKDIANEKVKFKNQEIQR